MLQISEPARRRLVLLASFLSRYSNGRVTSVKIQEATGIERDLVRKDISSLGFKGGASNGYDTQELFSVISEALSLPKPSEEKRCCIAGLGKLGAAIMQCGLFDGTAFKIAAGFDSSLNRIEVLNANFPLYPAAKMESVIPQLGIEFAILTVEDAQAASIAERLVKSGIRGIVNFTNEVFDLTAAALSPQKVFIENISPTLALNNICASMGGNKKNRK